MTATRIGRLATVVVLAAGWLVLAALLWRTSVPSDVDVHGLGVTRYFSPNDLARAASYQRFLDVLWLLEVIATLVALVVLAQRGPRLARSIRLGRIGTGVVIAGVVVSTLWLRAPPFGLAGRAVGGPSRPRPR